MTQVEVILVYAAANALTVVYVLVNWHNIKEYTEHADDEARAVGVDNVKPMVICIMAFFGVFVMLLRILRRLFDKRCDL